MTEATPRDDAPTKHHTAIMIWLCVTPTLIVINLLFAPVLEQIPMVLRTVLVATITVALVVYLLMPILHRIYRRIRK
ncbi:hypothetical protein [Microbacterium sp. BR1]|uniref:hypothetical protein n=1 Tax=Microbacterium sp. BR1 TaxID=1070896 RepID=UPI000C2C3837|nr:hypothetical protein [Microbacterium sp. BR1]